MPIDIRYAIRALSKSRAFTVTAVLCLAIGIGASTAIFSVVNAVLLAPPPFKDPHRLLIAWSVEPNWGNDRAPVTPADFLDWREQCESSEDMAYFRFWFHTLTGDQGPEQVNGWTVTPGFFNLLGIRPILGRPFLVEEEQPGKGQSVILAHSLWRHRYGADPGIIGQAITIDHKPRTVVGILPEEFNFYRSLGHEVQLWMPFEMTEQERSNRNQPAGSVYLRLREGITLDRAQAELDLIARQLARQYPDTNEERGVRLETVGQAASGGAGPTIWLLCTAACLLLLVACVTLANLLLARGALRQKELSLRHALGATRLRIVGQLLTESCLLSALGGLAGLIVAWWMTEYLRTTLHDSSPWNAPIQIDGRVMLFALLTSVLTGIVFGIVPAITLSSTDVNTSLKEEGGSATIGARGFGTRKLLVASVVAITVVLVATSALMVRSLYHLQTVDRGLDPQNLLTMQIELPRTKYPDDHHISAFFEDLTGRLTEIPRIRSAGVVSFLHLTRIWAGCPIRVEGRTPVDPNEQLITAYRVISPGYFEAMGIPLVSGRLFTEDDNVDARRVAILNKTLARNLFPHESPLGQRIELEIPDEDLPWNVSAGGVWITVVGVVGDVLDIGVSDDLHDEPLREVYLVQSQSPSRSMNLAVRTMGPPLSLIDVVQQKIRDIDADQPVASVRSMTDALTTSFSRRRFVMYIVSAFGTAAVLLAVVGIYGIVAYFVAARTRDIGVRLVLGASRCNILTLVLGQGLALLLAGGLAGIAGAVAVSKLLSSYLYGVSSLDWSTYLATLTFVLALGLVACYVPARRAVAIEPMRALRHE